MGLIGRLNYLYVNELRNLNSPEIQLVEALPKIANAAAAPELKQAFTRAPRRDRRACGAFETTSCKISSIAEGNVHVRAENNEMAKRPVDVSMF
jgi:Domain of unknown function (DUF892)